MDDLKLRVKAMIIERLKLEGMRPEEIEDSSPLFGDGLGLSLLQVTAAGVGIFA